MANVEGDSPNFDELKTPGEEAAEEPIFDGEAAPAEAEVEELQPVEAAEAETAEVEELEEIEEEEIEKEPSKLPVVVELAALIGVPAILLALFALNIIFISTAVYLIGLAAIPWGFWRGRKSNTVFTIFLGCTLAALLTASYCLWVELRRYDFDLKAQKAKQQTTMIVPVERELFV